MGSAMTTSVRPPFDPELKPFLDVMLANAPASVGIADVPNMRISSMATFPPIEEILAGTGFRHREFTVPGPVGAPDIILSVFDSEIPRESPGPVFYNIHGGGMIIG